MIKGLFDIHMETVGDRLISLYYILMTSLLIGSLKVDYIMERALSLTLVVFLGSGGPGGDSAWWRERSDVQGVAAVGVGGQPPDAAGSPVGSP